MQLFFNPNIEENDTTFDFDKEESRHISKVLRKKVGDQLHITNGKGWLFTAELSIASIKHCSVIITSKTLQPKPLYHLHLAVAPTKMNDRYEWFVEKATEIGVHTITPIICDHSERKVIKRARFEKIIQSAMKQSLQYYLPQLNDTLAFSDFISGDLSDRRFIAHCEESERYSLKTQIHQGEDCVILIGPEGDFSVKEISEALKYKFKPVTLGRTRLRTETAAIAACHSVAFVNE